jgi:hypothetical protein
MYLPTPTTMLHITMFTMLLVDLPPLFFLDHTKAHFSLSGKSLESTSNKVTPGLPPSTEKQPRNETEDQTKKKGYELSEGLHGERILLLVTVVHI